MTYNSIQPLMRIWLILLSYWPEFHTYFSKSGFATLRHIPTDATRKIFFLENYMICCFLSFFDSPGLAQPLVGIHTRLIRNSFAKTYRIFYISLESSMYKISKMTHKVTAVCIVRSFLDQSVHHCWSLNINITMETL